MSDSIMVYFNSGNRAKFLKENTVLVSGCPDSKTVMDSGDVTIVNWDNVSFIREYHEPKEDIDDAD